MARAAIAAEKAAQPAPAQAADKAAGQPTPAAAQAAEKANNEEISEHLAEEAEVLSTLPIQAEQVCLPPLPAQDELCPDTEYCDAIVSALVPGKVNTK